MTQETQNLLAGLLDLHLKEADAEIGARSADVADIKKELAKAEHAYEHARHRYDNARAALRSVLDITVIPG